MMISSFNFASMAIADIPQISSIDVSPMSSIPVSWIEDELMKFDPQVALAIFEKLNLLLLGNESWQKCAAAIRDKLIGKAKSEKDPASKTETVPASNAETKEADGMDFSHLPAALSSPNAKQLWRKLFEVGYVGATCKSTRSYAESAIMASAIARKLGMKRYWDFFSQIWEMPNLRSYLSKCMDSDSLYDFTVEVDKMLGLPPKAGLKPRICQDS